MFIILRNQRFDLKLLFLLMSKMFDELIFISLSCLTSNDLREVALINIKWVICQVSLRQEQNSDEIRNHRVAKTKTIKLSLIKQSSGGAGSARRDNSKDSINWKLNHLHHEMIKLRLRIICSAEYLGYLLCCKLKPKRKRGTNRAKLKNPLNEDDEIFIAPPRLDLFRKKELWE